MSAACGARGELRIRGQLDLRVSCTFVADPPDLGIVSADTTIVRPS